MRLSSLFAMAFAGLLTQSSAESIALKKLAEGFVAPVALAPFPGSDDLVVVDQIGAAYLIGADGARSETPFLDLRSKLVKLNGGFDERGFLSLAFHPKFPATPKVFVYYSGPLQEGAPVGWDHTAHLASFEVKGKAADLGSEKIILKINQPQFNHNSGKLVFGKDGLLFITMGDGGEGSDVGKGHSEGGNAQDLEKMLGKVLRINIDEGDPYSVPKDNPFVKKPGCDEIYAWGVRNPWGAIMNPDNDAELIIADVGQDRFAEVNVIKKGANYGWHIREGLQGFDAKDRRALEVEAPKVDKRGNPLVDPVLTYKNRNHPKLKAEPDAKGISITGGEVYTGKAIPSLSGKYVFGDWSQQWAPGKGRLFVADRTGESWSMADLMVEGQPEGLIEGGYVTAFGKDLQGEIYVLTAGQPGFGGELGAVHKIVPATDTSRE
ncbi:MAG: PQQ-dependent sugar dehydrogenase [Verrucomicrobiales bacterium]